MLLGEQKPQPIALLALRRDLLESAGAHDMRNPARIRLVSFVAHRRQ